MIDLYKFYFDNITQEHYHYQFFKIIENVNKVHNVFYGLGDSNEIIKFELFDDEEIIKKFKYLCQPDTQIDSKENRC